jgi:hypothetical protein
LGLAAPPAQAVAPTIELASPDNAAPLANPVVHVGGRAFMPSGGTVNGQLQIEVTSLEGHGGQKIAVNVSGNSVPFSWDYATSYNGHYRVKVTAQGRDGAVDTTPSETSSASRDVAVEVKPAPPSGLTAKTTKARSVDLAWKANPEPDIVGYQLQRTLDPEGEWTAVANTADIAYTDTGTQAAGGTYSYRVVAVRSASTSDQGIPSDPSETASAKVSGPPPTTTTTAKGGTGTGGTGGTGAGGAGANGTGAGGTSTGTGNATSPELARTGKVDLSGFSALLQQSKRPTPKAEEADPGFKDKLPFKPGEEPIGEDGTALGVGVREVGGSEGRQPVAFVAASLLVTVVLMHVLWLKRQVDRHPLGDLPADAPG